MDISTSVIVTGIALLLWVSFVIAERIITDKKQKKHDREQGRGAQNGGNSDARRNNGSHYRNY